MGFDAGSRPAVRRAFGVVAPSVLLLLAAWCSVGFRAPVPAQAPSAIRVQPFSDEVAEPPWADGPGTTEPGIYLSAMPSAATSGAPTLEVTELVWLKHDVDGVTLRPPAVEAAGDAFIGGSTTAGSVQVTADGQPVAVDSSALASPVQVAFPGRTRRFELRYELTTVTPGPMAAAAGPRGAALAPLSDIGSDLPVVVWASGTHVRTLQCPLLPPERRSCAVAERAAVRTLPGLRTTAALVVVQLDTAGR